MLVMAVLLMAGGRVFAQEHDYPDLMWSFYFDSINYGTDLYEKTSGFTVRLVRSTR